VIVLQKYLRSDYTILWHQTTQLNAANFPQPRYHLLEDTESIYAYRPGGFHPVTIGDVLADRYLIVHKLGFGGWSTIWMARDQHCGQYVAVKIALASTGLEEIQMLQELHNDAETHAAQSMIPKLLNHFVIRGQERRKKKEERPMANITPPSPRLP
jgi:hypothetical protein